VCVCVCVCLAMRRVECVKCAYKCPKHVEQIISAIRHSVASRWFSSLRRLDFMCVIFIETNYVELHIDVNKKTHSHSSRKLYSECLTFRK
jgi:hypothetical protein